MLVDLEYCSVTTENSWQGSNLVWFAFLYSLAAFLKLYIKDCSLIRWRWPIIVVSVSYMSVMGLDSITDKYATYLMRENRILVLGVTVSLFVIFWKIKKCKEKVMNTTILTQIWSMITVSFLNSIKLCLLRRIRDKLMTFIR